MRWDDTFDGLPIALGVEGPRSLNCLYRNMVTLSDNGVSAVSRWVVPPL